MAAAAEPEKNFWEQRRDVSRARAAAPAAGLPLAVESRRDGLTAEERRLLAQLPAAAPRLPFPSPESLSLPVRVTQGLAPAPRPAASAAALPGWIPQIVAPYGYVREAHLSAAPGAPLVVHVQDAHEMADAQRNISGLIRALAEERGVTLVGVEGAAGGFRLSPFRAFPDRDAVADVADYFLSENIMGGAEHAAFTAAPDLALWGLESPAPYLANIAAFREALPRQAGLRRDLKAWAAGLDGLKAAAYPPALKNLDEKRAAYRENRLGLGEYARYLRVLAPRAAAAAPNFSRLIKAIELEGELDFAQVEKERIALVETLAAELSPAALSALIEKSLLYRLGRVGYGDYHRHLRDLCRRGGVDLSRYAFMERYIDYVLTAESIRREALFGEIESVERAAFEPLLATPAQREIDGLARDFELVRKLVEFVMAPEDWDYYAARRGRVADFPLRLKAALAAGGTPWDGPASLGGALEPFEKFCETAVGRNEVLVDNLLKKAAERGQSAAVLVAGGFHTAGMAELMRRRGVSYLVVTPKIEAPAKDAHYLDFLSRDKRPLEKLFSGERITLKAPINGWTLWEPEGHSGEWKNRLAAGLLTFLWTATREGRDLPAEVRAELEELDGVDGVEVVAAPDPRDFLSELRLRVKSDGRLLPVAILAARKDKEAALKASRRYEEFKREQIVAAEGKLGGFFFALGREKPGLMEKVLDAAEDAAGELIEAGRTLAAPEPAPAPGPTAKQELAAAVLKNDWALLDEVLGSYRGRALSDRVPASVKAALVADADGTRAMAAQMMRGELDRLEREAKEKAEAQGFNIHLMTGACWNEGGDMAIQEVSWATLLNSKVGAVERFAALFEREERPDREEVQRALNNLYFSNERVGMKAWSIERGFPEIAEGVEVWSVAPFLLFVPGAAAASAAAIALVLLLSPRAREWTIRRFVRLTGLGKGWLAAREHALYHASRGETVPARRARPGKTAFFAGVFGKLFGPRADGFEPALARAAALFGRRHSRPGPKPSAVRPTAATHADAFDEILRADSAVHRELAARLRALRAEDEALYPSPESLLGEEASFAASTNAGPARETFARAAQKLLEVAPTLFLYLLKERPRVLVRAHDRPLDAFPALNLLVIDPASASTETDLLWALVHGLVHLKENGAAGDEWAEERLALQAALAALRDPAAAGEADPVRLGVEQWVLDHGPVKGGDFFEPLRRAWKTLVVRLGRRAAGAAYVSSATKDGALEVVFADASGAPHAVLPANGPAEDEPIEGELVEEGPSEGLAPPRPVAPAAPADGWVAGFFERMSDLLSPVPRSAAESVAAVEKVLLSGSARSPAKLFERLIGSPEEVDENWGSALGARTMDAVLGALEARGPPYGFAGRVLQQIARFRPELIRREAWDAAVALIARNDLDADDYTSLARALAEMAVRRPDWAADPAAMQATNRLLARPGFPPELHAALSRLVQQIASADLHLPSERTRDGLLRAFAEHADWKPMDLAVSGTLMTTLSKRPDLANEAVVALLEAFVKSGRSTRSVAGFAAQALRGLVAEGSPLLDADTLDALGQGLAVHSGGDTVTMIGAAFASLAVARPELLGRDTVAYLTRLERVGGNVYFLEAVRWARDAVFRARVDLSPVAYVYETGALAEESAVRAWSLALSAHRLLARVDVPANAANVRTAVDFVRGRRAARAGQKIFGPGVAVVNVAHEEDRFDVGRMEEAGAGSIQTGSFKGPSRKHAALYEINAAEGPLTVFFHGHGGPNHLWLGAGDAEEATSEDLAHPAAVSYRELGDAIAARPGRPGDVVLVLSSCFSHNFAAKLLNYLAGKGESSLPVILATSDFDRLSYGDHIFQVLGNPLNDGELRFSDVFATEILIKEEQDLTMIDSVGDGELAAVFGVTPGRRKDGALAGSVLPDKSVVTGLLALWDVDALRRRGWSDRAVAALGGLEEILFSGLLVGAGSVGAVLLGGDAALAAAVSTALRALLFPLAHLGGVYRLTGGRLARAPAGPRALAALGLLGLATGALYLALSLLLPFGLLNFLAALPVAAAFHSLYNVFLSPRIGGYFGVLAAEPVAALGVTPEMLSYRQADVSDTYGRAVGELAVMRGLSHLDTMYGPELDRALESLPTDRPAKVLVVGGGRGVALLNLQEQYPGLDLEVHQINKEPDLVFDLQSAAEYVDPTVYETYSDFEEMLEAAREGKSYARRMVAESVKAFLAVRENLHVLDISRGRNLEGLPDDFDLVIMGGSTLHYIEDHLAVNEALYRKLRPGGRLFTGFYDFEKDGEGKADRSELVAALAAALGADLKPVGFRTEDYSSVVLTRGAASRLAVPFEYRGRNKRGVDVYSPAPAKAPVAPAPPAVAPVYFTGTNSAALESILQQKRLYSYNQLKKRGLRVVAGMTLATETEESPDEISFTEEWEVAAGYANLSGGFVEGTFPVVLGFSAKAPLKPSPGTKGLFARDELDLERLAAVMVPADRIPAVEADLAAKLGAGHGVRVLPFKDPAASSKGAPGAARPAKRLPFAELAESEWLGSLEDELVRRNGGRPLEAMTIDFEGDSEKDLEKKLERLQAMKPGDLVYAAMKARGSSAGAEVFRILVAEAAELARFFEDSGGDFDEGAYPHRSVFDSDGSSLFLLEFSVSPSAKTSELISIELNHTLVGRRYASELFPAWASYLRRNLPKAHEYTISAVFANIGAQNLFVQNFPGARPDYRGLGQDVDEFGFFTTMNPENPRQWTAKLRSAPRGILAFFWPQSLVKRYPRLLAAAETLLFQGALTGLLALALQPLLGWDLQNVLVSTGAFSSALFVMLHKRVLYAFDGPASDVGWNPLKRWDARGPLLGLALAMNGTFGVFFALLPFWGAAAGVVMATLVHLAYNHVLAPRFSWSLGVLSGARWERRSFRSSVDGAEIAYDFHPGKGPVIVFVHGILLDKTFQIIRKTNPFPDRAMALIHRRGYPGSEAGSAERRNVLELNQRDLADLIGQFGRRKIVMVGHSLGGLLLMLFADVSTLDRQPWKKAALGRVQRAIFINPGTPGMGVSTGTGRTVAGILSGADAIDAAQSAINPFWGFLKHRTLGHITGPLISLALENIIRLKAPREFKGEAMEMAALFKGEPEKLAAFLKLVFAETQAVTDLPQEATRLGDLPALLITSRFDLLTAMAPVRALLRRTFMFGQKDPVSLTPDSLPDLAERMAPFGSRWWLETPGTHGSIFEQPHDIVQALKIFSEREAKGASSGVSPRTGAPRGLLAPFWPRSLVQRHPRLLAAAETFIFQGAFVGLAAGLMSGIFGFDMVKTAWVMAGISTAAFAWLHAAVYYDVNAPPIRLGWNPFSGLGARGWLLTLGAAMNVVFVAGLSFGAAGAVVGFALAAALHILYNELAPKAGLPLGVLAKDDHEPLARELRGNLIGLGIYSMPYAIEYAARPAAGVAPFEWNADRTALRIFTDGLSSDTDYRRVWWTAFKEWYAADLAKKGDSWPKIVRFIDVDRPHRDLTRLPGFPVTADDIAELDAAVRDIFEGDGSRLGVYRRSLDYDGEPRFEYPRRLEALRRTFFEKNAGDDDPVYWQGTSYLLEILKAGGFKKMAVGRQRTDPGMVSGIYVEESPERAAGWRLHEREALGYLALFEPQRFEERRRFMQEDGQEVYLPDVRSAEELSPLTLANKGPLGVVIGFKKRFVGRARRENDGLLENVGELPLDAVADVTFFSQRDYETFLRVAAEHGVRLPPHVKVVVKDAGSKGAASPTVPRAEVSDGRRTDPEFGHAFVYDERGRLAEVLDPAGERTMARFEYGDKGDAPKSIELANITDGSPIRLVKRGAAYAVQAFDPLKSSFRDVGTFSYFVQGDTGGVNDILVRGAEGTRGIGATLYNFMALLLREASVRTGRDVRLSVSSISPFVVYSVLGVTRDWIVKGEAGPRTYEGMLDYVLIDPATLSTTAPNRHFQMSVFNDYGQGSPFAIRRTPEGGYRVVAEERDLIQHYGGPRFMKIDVVIEGGKLRFRWSETGEPVRTLRVKVSDTYNEFYNFTARPKPVGVAAAPKGLLPFWPAAWVRKHPKRLAFAENLFFQGVLLGGLSWLLQAAFGWNPAPALGAAGAFSTALFTALHSRVYYDINAPPKELGWNPLRHLRARAALFRLAVSMNAVFAAGLLIHPVLGAAAGFAASLIIHFRNVGRATGIAEAVAAGFLRNPAGAAWLAPARRLVAAAILVFALFGANLAARAQVQPGPFASGPPVSAQIKVDLMPLLDGRAKKGVRRPSNMNWGQRLLLIGVNTAGTMLLANQHKDNKGMVPILLLDVFGNGLVSGVSGHLHGKNGWDAALWGSTGGLVMFEGKNLMYQGLDKPGFGMGAKVVHSFGVSMRNNVMIGKDPFSRFELDFGPLLLGVNMDDGDAVDFALLPSPLVYTTRNFLMGHKVDWEASMRVGGLMFRGDPGVGNWGLAQGNVMIMHDSLYRPGAYNFTEQERKAYLYAVQFHEGVHGLHFSEVSFLGRPIENWAHNKLSLKRPFFWLNKTRWIRWDREIGDGFFSTLGTLHKEHDLKLTERESEAWERLVLKKRLPPFDVAQAFTATAVSAAAALLGLGLFAAGFWLGDAVSWLTAALTFGAGLIFSVGGFFALRRLKYDWERGAAFRKLTADLPALSEGGGPVSADLKARLVEAIRRRVPSFKESDLMPDWSGRHTGGTRLAAAGRDGRVWVNPWLLVDPASATGAAAEALRRSGADDLSAKERVARLRMLQISLARIVGEHEGMRLAYARRPLLRLGGIQTAALYLAKSLRRWSVPAEEAAAEKAFESERDRQRRLYPSLDIDVSIRGEKSVDEVFGDFFAALQRAAAEQGIRRPAVDLRAVIDMEAKTITLDHVWKDAKFDFPYMAEEAKVYERHFPAYKVHAPKVIGPGAAIGLRRHYDAEIVSVQPTIPDGDPATTRRVESGEISLDQILAHARANRRQPIGWHTYANFLNNINSLELAGRVRVSAAPAAPAGDELPLAPEPGAVLPVGKDLLAQAVPPARGQLNEFQVVRLLPLTDGLSASSAFLSLLEALTISDGAGAAPDLPEVSGSDRLRLAPYLTNAEKAELSRRLRAEAARLRESLARAGPGSAAAEDSLKEFLRAAGRVHGQGGRFGATGFDGAEREILGLVQGIAEAGFAGRPLEETALDKAQSLLDVYNRARHTAKQAAAGSFAARARRAIAAWADRAARALREALRGEAAVEVFHVPLVRGNSGALELEPGERTDAWARRLARSLEGDGAPRTVLVANVPGAEGEGAAWTLIGEALAKAGAGLDRRSLGARLAAGGRILFREDVTAPGAPEVIRGEAVRRALGPLGKEPVMDIYTLWEDQWDLSNLRKETVRLLVILTGKLVVNATESLETSIEAIRYIRIQA